MIIRFDWLKNNTVIHSNTRSIGYIYINILCAFLLANVITTRVYAESCSSDASLSIEAAGGKIEVPTPTVYHYNNGGEYNATIDRDILHVYFNENNSSTLYDYSEKYKECYANIYLNDTLVKSGYISTILFLNEKSQYTKNFILLIDNKMKDNIDLSMNLNKKQIRFVITINGDR